MYGIVAGKTNTRNPDVNFSMNPKDEPRSKWNAREFLRLNKGFAWERGKVLVVVPKESSDKAAREAERWLQEQFGLWGS